jgi:ABC-type transporter Mla subunit MlaD
MSEIAALLKTVENTLAKALEDQRRPLSNSIEQCRTFAQIYRDVPGALEDLASSLQFQIEVATAPALR